MKPYIGITDFTCFEQVVKILEIFRRHKPSKSQQVLHVGVMMSYKTLNDIENKWSKAFPPKETIVSIFRPNNDNIYYCLHYADYNYETGSSDIARGLEYAGPFVHAIQLDMPWPDPLVVENGIHMSGRKIEVILQIGKRAFEEAENNSDEVVERLKKYEGVIDRVLLDRSMGRGLEMNAAELIPFAQAIKNRFPNLGLVVAGGLGPDSVELAEPLVKMFPDISIDAQGKLRPSGSALDPIDWDMASKYLVQALKILN